MNRTAAIFVAGAIAGACALQAQTMSAELKQMYNGVKNNLTRMAEKMPEENFSFQPTPEIRTFGQLVAHVADSQARTCSAVSGAPKSVDAAKKTSKAELVAALKESFELCDAAVNGTTDENANQMVSSGRGQATRLLTLARTVSHSNEEYGYMAVYMRLKNIVPPSSEKR